MAPSCFDISPLHIQAIISGCNHFPDRTPNRWDRIAEYVVKRTENLDTTVHVKIGKDSQKENITFVPSGPYCKVVYKIIEGQHPDFLLVDHILHDKVVLSDPEKNALKPLVLVPSVNDCIQCGKRTQVKRPSFPLVFTRCGVLVAACYTGRCEECKITFSYSYYEIDCDGKRRRIYYTKAVEARYFQSTSKTVFETQLLHQIEKEIVIGQMGFEACANVYNESHEQENAQRLNLLEALGRTGYSCWDLHEDRLQTAVLTYWLVEYFDSLSCVDSIDFPYDSTSCRRDLEKVAEEAIDLMIATPSKVMCITVFCNCFL